MAYQTFTHQIWWVMVCYDLAHQIRCAKHTFSGWCDIPPMVCCSFGGHSTPQFLQCTVAIRTVDTDVIVILIGEFHAIHEAYPNASIWIAFGTGKNFCYYHINTIYANLGKDKSRCLPVFHAFTGCDSTSSFFGKTKKSIWAAWNCFPQVSDAFLLIANNPFYQVDLESPYFQLLEHFTVIVYDKTSALKSVNEARKELFCKRNKSLEKLPPTAVSQ